MSGASIALIANLIFVIILVIGFFVGFWRGVKKSSVNLIFSVVGIIIAFFVTPYITDAILKITITVNGVNYSLNGYLISLINQSPDIAHLIEMTPSLASFIDKLPYAILAAVFFIVLVSLFELVFYLFYRILAWIFMRRKENEKPHRVWGGVVGTVKVFLLSIFAFLPFASLIHTANNVIASDNIYSQEVTIHSNQTISSMLPPTAKTTIVSLKNNAFTAIGGVFGLDDLTFDYLTKFQVEGENIKIREEIENYTTAFDYIIQFVNVYNSPELNLENIDYHKLEKVLDNILNGGFYKVASDVLTSFLTDYNSYSFFNAPTNLVPLLDKISLSLTELKSAGGETSKYFNNDLRSIFNAFKELSSTGAIDELQLGGETLTDILSTLTTDKNLPHLTEAFNHLFSMNIFKDSAETIANLVLEQVMTGTDIVKVDVKNWTEETWNSLSINLSNVFKEIASLTKQVNINTVISQPLQLLDGNYNVTEIMLSLGNVIDNIRAIPLFVNEQGVSVVDKLLNDNNINFPQNFYQGETQIEINSYKQMFEILGKALSDMKTSEIYKAVNDTTLTDSERFKIIAGQTETLQSVLLNLYQLEPTHTLIFGSNGLISSLNNSMINFSEVGTGSNKYENYLQWKKELGLISEELKLLNVNLQSGETYLDKILTGSASDAIKLFGNDLTITQVLTPILPSIAMSVLKSNIFEAISSSVRDLTGKSVTINADSTLFNKGDTQDQTNEVCKAMEELLKVYKVITPTTTIKEIDKLQLGKTLDALKENALRITINPALTNSGVLTEVYNALVEKFANEYRSELELAGITINAQDANINFTQIMERLT